MIVTQTQFSGKIFRMPLAIDVYEGGVKKRYPVWIQNAADTFSFSYKTRPSLINVDGDKTLLCEKQDHKTLENFIYQYEHAGLYRDKMEAILYCAKHQTEPAARDLLLKGLSDPFYKIRQGTLDALGYKADASLAYLEPTLEKMAGSDPNKVDRGLAIFFLGSFKNEKYKPIFLSATSDFSYSVAGRGLEALALLDSVKAVELARKMAKEDPRGRLIRVIQTMLSTYGDENDAVLLYDNFESMDMGSRMFTYQPYIKYLTRIKNTEQLKKTVDQIVGFREKNRRNMKQIRTGIDKGLKAVADQKAADGMTEQVEYIRSLLH